MSWENFGDVNPVEHGGIFIKKESKEFPDCYNVIRINTDDDSENTWILDVMYVDLNSVEWANWEGVNSYSDINIDSSDTDKVIALVSYYGSVEFGYTEIIKGEDEVIKKLKEFGIEV